MKKIVAVILLIVGVIAVTSCFILDKLQESKENEVLSLTAKIVPLEFDLISNGDHIEVDYRFLDLAGNLIAEDKVSLRGNELFVDCVVKELDSKTKVCFPVLFYSNIVPSSEGVSIVEAYNNNGFPEIFKGVSKKEAKKIKAMYTEVLEHAHDVSAFRSAPHVVAKKNITTYQLVARIKGGLELLRSE